MAVIKIVPMPGAKGDKGDDGATGATGAQGPIGATGAAGANALWSYNGAWQPNASYAVGDVVTYQGQLYYTKATTTVGTLPTNTTKFDLIAAKGEQGATGATGPQGEPGTPETELNFWNFVGDPGEPTESGALVIDGISARSGGDSTIHATTGGKVVLAGSNGEFLFDSNIPSNQIATIGDLPTGATGSFVSGDGKTITVTNGIITSIV